MCNSASFKMISFASPSKQLITGHKFCEWSSCDHMPHDNDQSFHFSARITCQTAPMSLLLASGCRLLAIGSKSVSIINLVTLVTGTLIRDLGCSTSLGLQATRCYIRGFCLICLHSRGSQSFRRNIGLSLCSTLSTMAWFWVLAETPGL